MIVHCVSEWVPGVQVDDIVDFYIAARQAAHTTLLDMLIKSLSTRCVHYRAQ